MFINYESDISAQLICFLVSVLSKFSQKKIRMPSPKLQKRKNFKFPPVALKDVSFAFIKSILFHFSQKS